jgi:5-methylcytosine-specific restriction protein A
MSLSELKQLAKDGENKTIKTRSVRTRQYYRSVAVKRYALARAEGVCECCNASAPFLTRQNEPYLEVHHLLRIADEGPDTPEGVAAICPTCHRRIHNGLDGAQVNTELSKHIEKKEHT